MITGLWPATSVAISLGCQTTTSLAISPGWSTWSIIYSFPTFCPYFQCKLNHTKPNMLPKAFIASSSPSPPLWQMTSNQKILETRKLTFFFFLWRKEDFIFHFKPPCSLWGFPFVLRELCCFVKKLFILCWSMVDWQGCDGLRCTPKWFSYAYTCIYSFSNSFPI